MKNFLFDAHRVARETIEHRPNELLLAANGFVIGSIIVSAFRTEFTQRIPIDEKLGFIEVFSNQGVRLLFLDVTLPPDGEPLQRTEVSLSDGRTLRTTVNFDNPWPCVTVVYEDPLRELATEPTRDSILANTESDHDSHALIPVVGRSDAGKPSDSSGGWRKLASRFIRLPVLTAVSLATPLIVLLVLNSRIHEVAAADLLKEAAESERATEVQSNVVVHRAVYVEEFHPKTREPIGRWKIETWQSAELGEAVWRLVNVKNQLVASEWKKGDGPYTFRRRGSDKSLAVSTTQSADHLVMPDDFVRLVPSAEGFQRLLSSDTPLEIEKTADEDVLKYSDGRASTEGAFVRASLGLDHHTHHAHAQTLFVWVTESDAPTEGPELREFRCTETSYQLLSPQTVNRSVFLPDTEFATQPTPVTTPLVEASAQFELIVLDQLLRANDTFGEQLTLSRTKKGRLLIRGAVETNTRENQILEALGSIVKDPLVQIAITVMPPDSPHAEPPQNSIVQEVVINQQTIPVDFELRSYLKRGGPIAKDDLDHQIFLFANETLDRSSRVRSRAMALGEITERFPPARLETIDPAARAELRKIVKSHAMALQASLRMLHDELEPVFSHTSLEANNVASEIDGLSDTELVETVKRLQDSCMTIDDAINHSFTLSADTVPLAPVNSVAFWDTMNTANLLAQSLVRVGTISAGEQQREFQ